MAYDQIAADAIRDLGETQERIAAVLADLERVERNQHERTHWDTCWPVHTPCLAARVRRTLTGEADA